MITKTLIISYFNLNKYNNPNFKILTEANRILLQHFGYVNLIEMDILQPKANLLDFRAKDWNEKQDY